MYINPDVIPIPRDRDLGSLSSPLLPHCDVPFPSVASRSVVHPLLFSVQATPLVNSYPFVIPSRSRVVMFPSIAHLLSLTLSASALIPAAAADQPGLSRRQNGLNAASVSTAEFKSRFEQSGIVPEVIAALDPPVSFYAAYKSANGQDALLVPGSTLTVAGTYTFACRETPPPPPPLR